MLPKIMEELVFKLSGTILLTLVKPPMYHSVMFTLRHILFIVYLTGFLFMSTGRKNCAYKKIFSLGIRWLGFLFIKSLNCI